MKGLIIGAVAIAAAIALFILYKRNAPATIPTGGSGSKSSFDKLCAGAAVAGASYAGGAQAGSQVAQNDNLTSGVCGLVKDGLEALGDGAKFVGKKTLQGAKAVGRKIEGAAESVGHNVLGIDRDEVSIAGIGSGTHAQVQAKLNAFVEGGGVLTIAQKNQIKGDDGGPGGKLYEPTPKISAEGFRGTAAAPTVEPVTRTRGTVTDTTTRVVAQTTAARPAPVVAPAPVAAPTPAVVVKPGSSLTVAGKKVMLPLKIK
jgi:hypothetical protein